MIGLVLAVVAAVISIATFSAAVARDAGWYVVLYGPIIAGIYLAVVGLILLRKGTRPDSHPAGAPGTR